MTDIYKGATSNSIFIELVDSSTGLPKTGILYTDVTGSYVRTRSARTSITMATLASASAAYSSGGFILVDDTNQPGVYRLDVPDAAFVTAVDSVVITVKATGCRTVSRLFNLVNINNQVAYAPNAVAGASGGISIVGSEMTLSTTGIDSILTRQMVESYAVDGTAPTLAQAIYLIQQILSDFSITGTSLDVKGLDGTTTKATITLNSATTPTAATRSA